MILQKEFYFIRHGQTDATILKCPVDADVPLNPVGLSQALSIEPLIASLPVKTVCYSPLKRAQETKDIVCKRLDVCHQEILGLTECSLEIWQRMTAHGKEAHLKGDESVSRFMYQVIKGMNEALGYEGPVLVVAHGGVHWALCCWMGVEHEWVIDHCVPIHFSISSQGHWIAKKVSHPSSA